MPKTDPQVLGVSRQNKNLLINEEGSVNVWFGPEAPAGKENNPVKVIPGKGRLTILRLYDPLGLCVNRTRRPGEIELQP